MSAPSPVFDVRGYEVEHGPALDALERAADHLRDGGLLGYPTETVYGFGGRCEVGALEALGDLKRREAARPFLLLISEPSQVPALEWSPSARVLSEAFWPGALTLVLADPAGAYPARLRGPTGGVAVRWTAHPVAGALVELLGEPLTSTSANAPGQPPAATAGEVIRALDELAREPARVGVVDAGALPDSAPSTLVDCTGAEPVVLREGAIPISRLRCVLPELVTHG